jgi:hypothetical protein
VTHDWEKWQKYWAPAVVNGKSIAERVKHAKSVLGAVEKEPDAIVGIHSHADLDRIRGLLSSGEEKHQTILVLSLILCDNADVQDFDLLIDSNFGDLRNKGRKKSQLIRDSLMKYVRKSGGLQLFLKEFETFYTAQTYDYGGKKMEMDDRCKQYWELIHHELEEDEAFDYLYDKLGENKHKEVTNRWFSLVRFHPWSAESVRRKLLELIEQMIDECEKAEQPYDVGGYDKEYILMGSIDALRKFPADDEAITIVLDGLLRLERDPYASGYLKEFIDQSNRQLRDSLLASDDHGKMTITALEGGEEEESYLSVSIEEEEQGCCATDVPPGEKSVADKIAGVLLHSAHYNPPVKEPYAQDVKELFKEVALRCGDDKFESLIQYCNSYFCDDDVSEIIDIFLQRKMLEDEGLTIEEREDLIVVYPQELGFFIRGLEGIKGPEANRILRRIYSAIVHRISQLIEKCVSPTENRNFTVEGGKKWARPDPIAQHLLGHPEKYDVNLAVISRIIDESNFPVHKTDYSRDISEEISRNYSDSIQKKTVVLEAVANAETSLDIIKDKLVEDLAAFDSHCRMLKFSLVKASKKFLSEPIVSDSLLSVLRNELNDKKDRRLGLLIGKILSQSDNMDVLWELDKMLPSVKEQEALIWSLAILDEYPYIWSQNIENALVWGLSMNSWTSRNILVNSEFQNNLSDKGKKIVENMIYDDEVHGYLKCCALGVIGDDKIKKQIDKLISMFSLGHMIDEITSPIWSKANKEFIGTPIIKGRLTVGKGSIIVPANFTRSLMFALSSTPKEELFDRLDDNDDRVRYGCAAILCGRRNLNTHDKVRPVLEEMRRKGIHDDYGLSIR